MTSSAPRLAALLLAAPLLLAGCSSDDGGGGEENDARATPSTTPDRSDPPAPTTDAPSTPADTPAGSATTVSGPPRVVDTIATGLEVPWGLAFLPDGDAVATERDSGRVLRIAPTGQITELGTVTEAAPQAEGGLLGVAVSPDFATDQRLFLYLTTDTDNRVVRTTLRDDRLGDLDPILTGIVKGPIHDGGRLEFGPDGYLYVSTGEAGEPDRAQDRDDLGGKILRITTDGDPAPGNPNGSPVWSWGHRNVQGLAFVGDQLWASEFGDSDFDELNRIERGANYGWPKVEGTGGPDAAAAGFVDPLATWDTDEASPSGLAYAAGHLWMAALRGERLWRVPVDGDRLGRPESFLIGRYGRMRTVAVAPDGRLWLTTSNRDGRAEPKDGDDRILLIAP
ncbi:PQQ-dependent sugar dehydrogenase [Nocardioides pantholopis]|uniref:PQQ-dependent sugar dehydrogenase n=1 Tax=Nocardioides pantholopis TaxID=2483798 RepID=UPI000FDABF02|nr:PQQ-dependent sugar dehydrogenase [Nocardioides pantholopis]